MLAVWNHRVECALCYNNGFHHSQMSVLVLKFESLELWSRTCLLFVGYLGADRKMVDFDPSQKTFFCLLLLVLLLFFFQLEMISFLLCHGRVFFVQHC